MLPVTKEQLVGSKYIIGLCGLVLAELLRRRSPGGSSKLHWTARDGSAHRGDHAASGRLC